MTTDPAASPSPELTPQDLADLKAIQGGADVFNYGLARRLRDLSKRHPTLVTITEAGGNYGPKDVHPYFGAIASEDGEAAVAASLRGRIAELLDRADKVGR